MNIRDYMDQPTNDFDDVKKSIRNDTNTSVFEAMILSWGG